MTICITHDIAPQHGRLALFAATAPEAKPERTA
jgi:hypothetical protein